MGTVKKSSFPHPLIPRVDAASESLFVRDSLKHLRQLRALLGGERNKKCLLMLPSHLPDPLQDFTAIPGQMERIQAPVVGVCLPLNKLTPFQIVENCHQPAGMNLEPQGKFLLADSRRRAQQTQDTRIRG